MRSINKVILIGNVTRDPEIKQTVSGQPIATFGIATNRDWMTRNGEHHTSSEFHEVVAWSKLAEICKKYIRKGKLVYVEGYLKTRSWDTPEGVKKFRTEIVVNDLIMLDKRSSDEHEPGDEHEHDMQGHEDNGMDPMPEDMPMEEHDGEHHHES